MKYRVTAPVKGATATVAGVAFADSVATVDDSNTAALAYFRRHGYRVEAIAPAPIEETPASSDQGEDVNPDPASPPAEQPPAQPKPPARSASKVDWVAYAVSQGMDQAEAESRTRDQLAELFAEQPSGGNA